MTQFPTSQASILIVDPDLRRRASLGTLLRESGGYRVQEVSSKSEALEHCRAHHSDLVLLAEHFLDWLRSPSSDPSESMKHVNSIVHDLKQPLQSIGFNLYALKQALQKNDIGQGHQLLAETTAAVKTLTDLIAQILSGPKLEP